MALSVIVCCKVMPFMLLMIAPMLVMMLFLSMFPYWNAHLEIHNFYFYGVVSMVICSESDCEVFLQWWLRVWRNLSPTSNLVVDMSIVEIRSLYCGIPRLSGHEEKGVPYVYLLMFSILVVLQHTVPKHEPYPIKMWSCST